MYRADIIPDPLAGFFGDVVVPVNFLASSTKPYNSTMLSLLEDCLPTALGQVRDRVRSQVVQDPDAVSALPPPNHPARVSRPLGP